jgi:predicted metalloendopeptidase
LGFGAAEALVRTTFDKTVQDGASILTSNIVKALIEIIQNKEWMDDETKNNAKIKANQLERLIAFPEWVMNVAKMNEYYDGLKISNKVSFGTLNLATRSWAVRKNFDSIIILNTDRVSFRGSPVLTNAWYQSSKNSIVIPIGELHSPAFGRDYPYNLAYGALGALVGHEVGLTNFDYLFHYLRFHMAFLIQTELNTMESEIELIGGQIARGY